MRATEWVIQSEGTVRASPGWVGESNLVTGEMRLRRLRPRILNPAKTPPFAITKEEEVDENTRLRYRYLDLRRERMRRT